MDPVIGMDPKDERRKCCGTAFDAVHTADCPRWHSGVRVEPENVQEPQRYRCCDSFLGHAHSRNCPTRWGDGL